MPRPPGRVGVHDARATVAELDGKTGTFTATKPSAGNHGPVRVRNTFHFAYADGTPYFPVGTTCYAWTHQGDELEEQTLATLKAGAVQQAPDVRLPEVVRLQQERAAALPVRGHAAEQVGLRRASTPSSSGTWRSAIGQLRDLGHRGRPDPVPPLRRGPLGLRPDARRGRRPLPAVRRRPAGRVPQRLVVAGQRVRLHEGEEADADWDRFFQIVARGRPVRPPAVDPQRHAAVTTTPSRWSRTPASRTARPSPTSAGRCCTATCTASRSSSTR